MTAAEDCLVVLKGGRAVPLEPVILAWTLASRGFRFQVVGDQLLVAPASDLTADEWRALSQWKPELRTLVRASETLVVH
jgi:hypothetical protein